MVVVLLRRRNQDALGRKREGNQFSWDDKKRQALKSINTIIGMDPHFQAIRSAAGDKPGRR